MYNLFRSLAILVLLIISTNSFSYELNPPHDSNIICTTDNKDFAEMRYPEQIPYCERNVSSGTKAAIYKKAGISKNDQKNYTIDHIVMISIGYTNNISNLWAEHKDIKNHRLGLEYDLYRALRDGCIKQELAISVIKENKYNAMVMQLPTYRSFTNLGQYLESRKFPNPECTQNYLTKDSM